MVLLLASAWIKSAVSWGEILFWGKSPAAVPVAAADAVYAPWSFAGQSHPWFPPGRRKQGERLGSPWKSSITATFPLHQPHGKTLGLCPIKVSL